MRKIIYFIAIFFSFSNICKSQIIAGQTGIGITYTDLIPDSELNAYPSQLPGDTSISFNIDIDQDAVNDFTFAASGGAGASHSIWTTTISPLGNIQVACLDSVSEYNPCCMNFSTVRISRIFSLGDTIQEDSSFFNNSWRALNYDYALAGHGTFAIHDWITAGENYIGFRKINLSDTIYGWIRVFTPDNHQIFIRDYAFGNIVTGNPENVISENEIILSPNPANDKLSITSEINLSNIKLQVVNIYGEIVFEKKYAKMDSETELDVSKVKNGIYFLSLIEGEKIRIYKFIIQH